MKNRFFSLLAFVALLFLGQGSVAHAAWCPSYATCAFSDMTNADKAASNIDLNDYATGSTRYSVQSGVSGDPLSSMVLVNASVTTGNKTSGSFVHVEPQDVGAQQNYLAVFGSRRLNPHGAAILTFNAGITNVSFEWGSVDGFNSFTVFNGAGQHYTIDGNTLLTMASASYTDGISKYFSLTDLAGIKSIIFKSTHDAFEIAYMAAVPLPAALPLFGAGLGGLFLLRRRKQRA